MLLLSSAAHSLLGWKALRAGLLQAHAPADLILDLSIGWHLAGVAMLIFSIVVIIVFTDVARGRAVSLRPALVIGIGYLAYGCWALAVSEMNPFFLVFIIPGVLLVIASWR